VEAHKGWTRLPALSVCKPNRLVVRASIVEGSDDAIVSKDLNGIVTSWNHAAEVMFGYNAAEMIGKPIATLFPPNRHIEEAGILDRTRRAERCDHYEAIADYKDGTSIDASVIVSPAKDETGPVVGASKIVRDIAERKEAQARHDILTCEIKLVRSWPGRGFRGSSGRKPSTRWSPLS